RWAGALATTSSSAFERSIRLPVRSTSTNRAGSNPDGSHGSGSFQSRNTGTATLPTLRRIFFRGEEVTMANKSLFAGLKSLFAPARPRNGAGGPPYALPPKHALAQIAATGCFNGTFYAEAEDQLETLRALVAQVNDNQFLAKLAVYSRERACMK